MQKSLTLALAIAAALVTGASATAQDFSTTISLPGSPGITTYNRVPDGFDPAAASASDLELYGYPRRPDISDTKAYGRWLQAVSTTRITPELVVNPGRYHRPNQVISKSDTVNNTTNATSGNWSGYSLIGGTPAFDEVVGVWIVPSVSSQSQSINGYMSMWVGIDGNCTCNDLIQDGTEQQYTGGKATYYAWIEFIPNAEVIVNNFPVSPGDVIYAYSSVAVRSGKVNGIYYLANYNTGKSVSASIVIPPKTSFSGKSAEWIVERTEVNGSFTNPLPKYAYAYMADAWAYRSGSTHAIDYTAQANENIVMKQGTTSLSKAYEQDASSMWFQWLAY